MKLANLSKILKCAGNDDAITMKSEDNGDTITFMFESQSEQAAGGGCCRWACRAPAWRSQASPALHGFTIRVPVAGRCKEVFYAGAQQAACSAPA